MRLCEKLVPEFLVIKSYTKLCKRMIKQLLYSVLAKYHDCRCRCSESESAGEDSQGVRKLVLWAKGCTTRRSVFAFQFYHMHLPRPCVHSLGLITIISGGVGIAGGLLALKIWINSRRQKIAADNFKFGGNHRRQFLLLLNNE